MKITDFLGEATEYDKKLPNLNFKASGNDALYEALNEALTEKQKLMLDVLRNNPTITQKEIVESASLSRSTVQRTIKELTEIGRLERIGSTPLFYYRIAEIFCMCLQKSAEEFP